MKLSKLCAVVGTVFPLSIALLGTASAQNPPNRPPTPERGRELIGPDGRTYTDKQNRFSIRLPAPNWKVYREEEPNPSLSIGDPSGQQQILLLQVKLLPGPIEKLKEAGEDYSKKQSQPFQRSVLLHPNGMNCWEFESEEENGPPESKALWHALGRICDLDALRKITVGAQLPVDQWKAEEKNIREMIESFRILH
jgi:hypothetical protein